MKCAVVSLDSKGYRHTRFMGTYDECIDYMRTNTDWDDLHYLNEDGTLGRYASWVL